MPDPVSVTFAKSGRDGEYALDPRPAEELLRRFTAYCDFDYGAGLEETGEEIDVDATCAAEARAIVEAVLASGEYDAGGQIVALEERHGLYF